MDNHFKQVGYVSTEGGPLLVGDYKVLTKWNGCETEDYDTLLEDCMAPEDCIYNVEKQEIVVWEPEGGAIISIHKDDKNNLILIKSFEDIRKNNKYVGCIGKDETIIGQIEISSEAILVIYATESGALLEPLIGDEVTRLTGGLVFGDSALAIPIPNGTYHCVADFVFGSNDELYQAKRLLLRRA